MRRSVLPLAALKAVSAPRTMYSRWSFVLLFALACTGTGCDSSDPASDVQVHIQELRIGTGTQARDGDMLTVGYVGKFTDGVVFDSTEQEKPFRFVLGGGSVIQGWEDGVPGMRVGGVRRLTIPPQLAYGNRGAGCSGDTCVIPPNTTLIFDITLVQVSPVTP